MSLVNDMLRDLEARRAAPAERQQLGDMHAVDERGAVRRERFERLRRWLLLLAAVTVVAIVLGLFVAQALRPVAQPLVEPVEEVTPVVVPTQLLDVLPQNDGRRFVLQLLFDRSVSYQRTDQSGSVSFGFDGVQLRGGARSGRVEKDGRSLSWRVEEQSGETRVHLTGLGDQLNVRDRLEPAGDRWQLWLEIPLDGQGNSERNAQQDLPTAELALPDDEQLPAWVTRTVDEPAPAAAAAQPVENAAELKAANTARRSDISPEPAAVVGQPDMNIAAHRPGALAQAQKALRDGDHQGAIRELQALHKAQPNNAEVTRWLARAYLTARETPALLAWLPSQLELRPFDAELRELLARGQLQGGDIDAAIATLQRNPPDLFRDSAYHALLAALYQQAGNWAGSAALYRQLVAAHPDQASWQLGLAIALEQLNQPTLAGRHYRQALQGKGLDDNARRFASERARSLGGAQ